MELVIALLAFVGIIGMFISLSIVNGWVLSYLWAWFVVPVFGLPELTIAQALGLSLIFTMLTHHPEQRQQEEENNKYKALARFLGICIRPFFILLIGYIIKQYV